MSARNSEEDEASLLSDFWDDEIDEDAIFQSEGEAEFSPGPPSSKKKKKKRMVPLVACHICQKRLNSLDEYKKHLKMHLIAELFLSAPDHCAVTAHCRIASKEILSKYVTCPLFKRGFSGGVILLVSSLLNTPEESLGSFVDYITDLIWSCMPSSTSMHLSGFHSAFNKSVNQDIVCDSSIRSSAIDKMKEILGIVEDKDQALKFLVGDFMMKLASAMESYYLKCIREPQALSIYGGREEKVTRDNLDDQNVQWSVYYIGGSTVRTVMNKAVKATKSPLWKAILPCLLDHFISDSLGKAPVSEVTAWTEVSDRGGLIFISEPAWSFLMALSQILVDVERPDGSLSHEEVYENVKNDGIIYNSLWCDLVGEKLSQKERDFLLQHVCETFTITWGSGVGLRRTNAMSGKSRDRVALRPSLL